MDVAASDIIKALLKIKPNERLGAENITDLKNHAFF
jgi:hypothetical protein